MTQPEKSYDSVVAAKYLLALAYSKGKILNVTKVQKLLYIAYGYFLANEGRILLTEQPKAWPYGPVFPRTRKKVNFSELISVDDPELAEIKQDQKVTDFFKDLIEKYSNFTASQLSEWSHSEGGPWDSATKQKGFNWNEPIPNELIEPYFLNLKL